MYIYIQRERERVWPIENVRNTVFINYASCGYCILFAVVGFYTKEKIHITHTNAIKNEYYDNSLACSYTHTRARVRVRSHMTFNVYCQHSPKIYKGQKENKN